MNVNKIFIHLSFLNQPQYINIIQISVEVKYQKEFEALKEILDSLDHHVKQDLFETWIQYEK